tara:strand:+ start:2253 stop:3458 length:1206 start_codon:yes stop_codon:yes gene_type:complete
MVGKERELILFTRSFPYGHGEEFIYEEILQLSHYFKFIYIIHLEVNEYKRKLPHNVIVKKIDVQIYKTLKVTDISLFIGMVFNNIFYFLKNGFLNNVSYLKKCFLKSYALNNWIKENIKTETSDLLFYSYWFDEWATILSILSKKRLIKEYVSKVHGFDLYEFRRKSNKIPFRNFQLSYVSKLFFISKDGRDYFIKKYPKFHKKYFISYLGTKDYNFPKYIPNKNLTILTISRIDANKQLNLLIEILQRVTIGITWIHFGDGPMRAEFLKKSLLLPYNITLNYMGQTHHNLMMEKIKESNVDLLINISKHEGLPVSMMEALSLGIPVFATDVGGVREIVNSDIGILYKQNEIFNLANDIENFKSSKFYKKNTRTKCRKVWKNNFESNVNYRIFADKLMNIK